VSLVLRAYLVLQGLRVPMARLGQQGQRAQMAHLG
jgi:hypothetical protein